METRCSNRCPSCHVMLHHSTSSVSVSRCTFRFGWAGAGPHSALVTAPAGVLRILVFGPAVGSEGLQNVQSPLREDDAFVYVLLPSLLLARDHVLCEKGLQSILGTATAGVISVQTRVQNCHRSLWVEKSSVKDKGNIVCY